MKGATVASLQKAAKARAKPPSLKEQFTDESVRPSLGIMPMGPGGFARGVLGRAEIAAANAKNEMRSGGSTYFEQKFKTSINVRVHHAVGRVHDDAVKGMNAAHALWRAARNWPSAIKIERIP